MAILENDKWELFCIEYMVDLNATRAYLRVWPDSTYNAARINAAKLKANASIRARIREMMDARSKTTLVDAEFVVTKLLENVERCQQAEEVFKWIDGEMVATGEWQFDSQGANKALELLGKHCAMFTENISTDLKVSGLPQEAFNQLLEAAKKNNEQSPG